MDKKGGSHRLAVGDGHGPWPSGGGWPRPFFRPGAEGTHWKGPKSISEATVFGGIAATKEVF